jgi:hypothetical protein
LLFRSAKGTDFAFIPFNKQFKIDHFGKDSCVVSNLARKKF